MRAGQLIYYNANGVVLRKPSLTGHVWRRGRVIRVPCHRPALVYWLSGLRLVVTVSALGACVAMGVSGGRVDVFWWLWAKFVFCGVMLWSGAEYDRRAAGRHAQEQEDD